ncbi:MAG: ATP-dependent Clp protease ATP-binding subunit [Elainellaceae cyanobacterium]
MFEQFTDKAIAVVMIAQQETRRLGHSFVGTEQILLGLIGEGTSAAARVLKDLGLTLETVQAEVEKAIGRGAGPVPAQIPLTPKTKRVLEQAFQESRNLDHRYVGPEHLLLSLTKHRDSVAAKILENLGINLDAVRTKIIRELGEAAAVPVGGEPQAPKRFQGKALKEFGADLTEMAAQGKIDPVIGRQREIERVIQILGRRTKNNPVLIGEPGVGKTAIAEGLAHRIVDRDVPEMLEDKRIIRLDMGLLVGGTRFRGEFEERLKQITEEVRQDPSVILVIDEIHTLVGAGSMEGGIDAANLLKPALARGELQCIGATTLDEYRKHIERDAALERRLQPIQVGEPTVEETVEILGGLRARYEQHHQLTITDEALDAAAKLSDRYISDRFLPDKAIDLIDEAGSRVRLRHYKKLPTQELKQELRQVRNEKTSYVSAQEFDKATELRDRELALEEQIQQVRDSQYDEYDSTENRGSPLVTEEDIAQVVSVWTGVPVNRLTESESMLILHLEDTLHERLIGQDEAVAAVSRAIRRSRVGLNNPNRPIASLFFSGPTGVGKTELAKAIAASVFGSESAMIRLDMSEFMERHTASKLIGSPPGFVGYEEGGQLTEAVRRKPYSVLLLDEIEKAHPDVFNMLLQILEDGRLTDAKGRVVNFNNTLLIMTSNIGSRVIEKGGGGIGFDVSADGEQDVQYNRIRSLVHDELKQYFRPEFLNRLDEVIVFRQLKRDEVKQIAELMIHEVTARLADKGIGLELTEAFKERIVLEGYDPRYGARPLRRAIARLVEDHLAEALLSNRVQEGGTAVMDVDDDGQIQVQGRLAPELVGIAQQ